MGFRPPGRTSCLETGKTCCWSQEGSLTLGTQLWEKDDVAQRVDSQ